jgi:hypothetical protein
MFNYKSGWIIEVFGGLEDKIRHGIELLSYEIKIISTQKKNIFIATFDF